MSVVGRDTATVRCANDSTIVGAICEAAVEGGYGQTEMRV